MKRVEHMKEFAKLCHEILHSDRDIVIAFGGMTGEGKSVAMSQLAMEYCQHAGLDFTFDRMTWDRTELFNWIDGDKEGKGRLPEYSYIIADELISMFYKRNWYEDAQKAAVELLNKCRDRHQLVMGGIPNFWDLDGGLLSRIRFYVFIPKRGIMWVFQQENNPFASDKWNVLENKKRFRKRGNPYSCPNFVCEIHFSDLKPGDKKRYYKIRNEKRRNTELQNKQKEPAVKYKVIKQQRGEAVRLAYETGKYTQEEIAERLGVSRPLVNAMCNATD